MSSSSSDEEDLSKFASCAVSADQLEQNAQLESTKRTASRSARATGRVTATAAAAAAVAAGPAASKETHGAGDDSQFDALDPISSKIAAALNAILAKDLDDTSEQCPQKTERHAAQCLQSPVAGTSVPPVGAAAGADNGGAVPAAEDGSDDATGVQLFRAVPKGTPCSIQQQGSAYEGAAMTQLPGHEGACGGQQAHSSSFLAASIPRRVPMRSQIARLNLAETSKKAGKRQHEQLLAALAVDGTALLAEATAAGYGSKSTAPSSAAGTADVVGVGRENTGAGLRVCSTAAWLKGWKRMKGSKAHGVVLDAKEFVPFDVRAAKLTGVHPTS